jgi:hypothetical protein
MTDRAWRNFAEDAVNDLFKEYVSDQALAVIRQQIDVATFKTKVLAARDQRQLVLEALDTI